LALFLLYVRINPINSFKFKNMKLRKLLPLMLLAFVIAFAGCKKGPAKLIAKTWKVADVVAKGTVNDSIFQLKKAELLKVEMTFKDNKYTMTSGGTTLESGTYSVENDKLLIKTEKGMTMDAVVTKDKLTLDTPDFTTTLQPK
jgi:hypothetical protein